MCTSDSTTSKLHWEVEGHTPIAEPEEKIAILEQKNIDRKQKIAVQEQTIINKDKELKELQLKNNELANDLSKVQT